MGRPRRGSSQPAAPTHSLALRGKKWNHALMFGRPVAPAEGRYFRVSRFRQLVIDLMHFSAAVPSITIERRMDLAQLVAVREACRPSPSWSAIFVKAFAVVAARTPLLRTAYLTLPWARYYEHARNIATLSIDRQLADERIVLYVHVPAPEQLSLAAIDATIAKHQHQPVESLPSYRVAVRLAGLPWPLRRLAWRVGLDMLGPTRCRYFGTFGITSLGAQGAGMLNLVPLLTSTIHYGMFDPGGRIDMRLSFDHRVFDGATAAQALADMSAALDADILRECAALVHDPNHRQPG